MGRLNQRKWLIDHMERILEESSFHKHRKSDMELPEVGILRLEEKEGGFEITQ